MRMNTFMFFLTLSLALAIGSGLGFFLGRITAPSKVERIVERVLVPTVSAIADTIAFKKECLLDIDKLGRANKVCKEQLGKVAEQVRAQKLAAQAARAKYDEVLREPKVRYDTQDAMQWAAQPIPAEVSDRIAAAVLLSVPAHQSDRSGSDPCHTQSERSYESNSDAASVSSDSACSSSSSFTQD